MAAVMPLGLMAQDFERSNKCLTSREVSRPYLKHGCKQCYSISVRFKREDEPTEAEEYTVALNSIADQPSGVTHKRGRDKGARVNYSIIRS